MNNDVRSHTKLARLPNEPIDWVTKPFLRFLHVETTTGIVLLLFTLIALILSNSPWSHFSLEFWETSAGFHIGSFEFTRSLREWINDALMTFFFFLVALELKRELVLGELNNLRMAALSTTAAIGGMLVPAILYLILQHGRAGQHGWGAVMATDTAFVIACLNLLGNRIPYSLRVFMLSLAIVDDIGSILVVAFGYSNHINWLMVILSAIGFGAIGLIAKLGLRNILIYFLLGSLVWLTIDASGIHATITGVILGLMTPAYKWISDERLHAILDQAMFYSVNHPVNGGVDERKALKLAETATREALSPIEQLEIILHPWVGFIIMPLFALANAGMTFSFTDIQNPVAMAIFIAFAIGKPVGVLSFTWLALKTGLALCPPGLTVGLIAVSSILTGIGFTMALFISNLAFSPDLINPAKLGILAASIFSAITGMTLLIWKYLGFNGPKARNVL